MHKIVFYIIFIVYFYFEPDNIYAEAIYLFRLVGR